MQYSQTSSNETKTLLCITALCLVKTRWSADFLRAVGLVLDVPAASVDGAITLLYDPIAMQEDEVEKEQQHQQNSSSMVDRAESMAAGLRSSFTQESAVNGLVRMLFLIVRDGQELAVSWQSQKKKTASDRELVQRMLQLNGRTSVVLRRLALLLRVKISSLAALEEIAIRELQQEAKTLLLEQQKAQQQQQASLDDTQQEDRNDKNSSNNSFYSSLIRTAKIGAAATAAGGLLFVTGGLAAPALAAGLAGLGLAGAATLATHTAMAALLGVGGAGLGAYKMSRRTAGLEQFEFRKINTTTRQDNNPPPSGSRSSCSDTSPKKEEQEEWNGMTVYICVSGYLRQPGPSPPSSDVPTTGTSTTPTKTSIGSSFLFPPSKQQTIDAAASSPDFYGPWGAQPPCMFPSQVLERFYSVVAPEKVRMVPYLLETYEGQEDALMDELAKRYKVHPKTVHQPLETQPDYYVTGGQIAPYITLIRNFMDQAKGQTPPALVFTEKVLSTLMDSEKPWDKAYLLPKEWRTSELLHDDIPTEEEMKQKMAEMETKLSGAPPATKESILMDEETMHNFNEEIELVDLKESRSQSESVGESGVADTTSLQSNEVYWWRKSVAHYGDQYTVIWDPDKLLAIGQCFESLIAEGIQRGISNTLAYTALSAVMSAVALPLQIINLMGMLDESWTLAIEAADEAGKLLADALMSGMHGNRPVVLIGYSVGGRVVTSCLSELGAIAMGTNSNGAAAVPNSQQERPDDDCNDDYSFLTQQHIETDTTIDDVERQRRLRAATIVRDAVIIGAPCGTSSQKWAKRRSVVSGRLINVYSPHDWVLSLLYRYRRMSVIALAGLQEVSLPSANKEKNHRDLLYLSPIENYCVSDIVSTHGDYPAKINEILDRIGIGDVNRETDPSNYFLVARGSKQKS
jgi:hypothetical protein